MCLVSGLGCLIRQCWLAAHIAPRQFPFNPPTPTAIQYWVVSLIYRCNYILLQVTVTFLEADFGIRFRQPPA